MNHESWLNSKWRPMMGWMYMVVCIFDFIIFPIAWSLLQASAEGMVTSQWDPLTLKGAGLFHMAMGAVLGIAAWSRGQEKIAGVGSFSSVGRSINTNLEDPPFRNTRND